MNEIDIYRGASLFTKIKPENSSIQFKKVMGENQLQLNFRTSQFFDFEINDYCTVFGERYQFNELPIVKKLGTTLYEFQGVMESEASDLGKIQFLFLGSNNILRESDFSLMGDATMFIDLVIANAQRIDPTWVKGEVIPTGYKNLSFKEENCYNALSKIAEAFGTEFWIEGKTIHLVKVENDTGIVLQYGKNKGLYDLTRTTVAQSGVFTRLYAYGSDRNLPAGYQNYSKRLSLPPAPHPCLVSSVTATVVDNGNGTRTFTFSFTPPSDPGVTALQLEYRISGSSDPWTNNAGAATSPRVVTVPTLDSYDFVFRTLGAVCGGIATLPITVNATFTTPILVNSPIPYLEKNVAKYGVREAVKIFEDVYPHRTGTVTSVNVANEYQFSDTNINFDVNAQLLPGISPKITFNTGQLAGYEFDVASFDNGTKTFIILKNKNERVLDIPNSLLKPAIGDEYVMTDINMPQSYIDAAEIELQTRAQAFLDDISEPQHVYAVNINPVYLMQKGYILGIGDMMWIIDQELEVQKRIRIISTSRNLINEFQYQVDIADAVTPGKIEKILADGKAVTQQVSTLQQTVITKDIWNNKVIGDFSIKQGTLVFDITALPTHAAGAGFSDLLVENATGKVYRKV